MKKNIIIGSIVIILCVTTTLIIYKSNALYKTNDTHNFINNKVIPFSRIKYYKDNISITTLPTNDHYTVLKNYTCTNSQTGKWNSRSWKFTLNTLTNATDCNLYFKTITYTNFKNKILADNTLKNGTPSFTTIATNTDSGLYTTADDYGTSYYFRGNVVNNNVLYAGFAWKIIRINGNGSVRLIFNGTDPNDTSESKSIGGFYYNSYSNAAATFVGYMISTPNAASYALEHANNYDSNIKNVIDYWYENKIANDSIYPTKIEHETVYCNDRMGDSAYLLTIYGPIDYKQFASIDRCYSHKANPTLKCNLVNGTNNDRFTSKNSTNSSYGNKKLKYPVATITIDEINYAGLVNNTGTSYDATNNYLVSGQNYFTMTPYTTNASLNGAYVWFVSNTGKIVASQTNVIKEVRPVLSLKNTVNIISDGDGTKENPYVIED